MRPLDLPSSLLLLVAAQTAARQLPPVRHPVSIRKMAPGSAEKLLDSYVAFAPLPAGGPGSIAARAFLDDREALLLAANSSAALSFRPAFRPSAVEQDEAARDGLNLFRRAAAALAALQRRQWGCPSGTSSCAAIGYPYSCCHDDETCYQITDTGLGPVGCCPAGATCGGTISTCGAGDLACPSDLGGGCCIAGYVCAGVGCVLGSTTSTASTATTQPVTTFTTTSTSVLSIPTPSTVVVTVIVTQTAGGGGGGGGGVTTQTTTQTTMANPTSATTSGVAPVKPTLTATSQQTLPSGYCPTGYYACHASAGGGCCQTGRDCATTSCPPPPASTTVVSNGQTIVVPVGTDAGAPSSTCAAGWFLCPSSAGPIPGCCPSGYNCGTASCTLVAATATATVQKVFPAGSAADTVRGAGRGVVAAVPAILALLCYWR